MKEPIKVVRIEHPSDGQGVWNSANQWGACRVQQHSQYYVMADRHRTDQFPNYDDDVVLKEQITTWEELIKYHFAFKTIDQLQNGFTSEELKEFINDLGFKILMYTVTDYFESPYQVVFIKTNEVQDISHLFI